MNETKTIAPPVLVTGATGFIGRSVVEKLLSNNTAVRALVLPGDALPRSWENKVSVVRGSISDPAAVAQAMDGAATVIHLAAVVSDWGDERLYWEFTVEGSRHLFDQAVKTGARVVLVSSIVVYGDKIQAGECPEEAGYGKTFGPYSRTKQAQEKLAWEYHAKGMRLSVVRPANVYGPGSGPWLHDVVNVLKSGSPGLISGGERNAGLAYVDNVADIILLAGTQDEALGRAYNACDGLSVTWKQYFADIASMIGAQTPKSIPRPVALMAAWACESTWRLLHIRKRPPITREALNLIGSDNRIPASRVRTELGYEPRVGYDRGMQQTQAYIQENMRAKVADGAAPFAGKLAFITGGSSGIGHATARLLAQKGCDLVLFARGQKQLDEVCLDLSSKSKRASQRIHALCMDVADNSDVQNKIGAAISLYGTPDILINSAGLGSGDYFENIDYDRFDRTMKVNVYGTRNTIGAVLPAMKRKGAGQVVNIASVAGLIGMFGYTLYGTTKYALVGLSECLRSELKRFNIAVTLVCPPEVRTPLIEAEAKTLPPEARAVKSLGGFLEPETVAKAIVRGIEKKRFLVIPGLAAKFLFFNHRISNGRLTRYPSDLIVALAAWRARRKANH
ncbi:MAG: SDR family NAD(P)-dependent oxidoreductase [Desulfobacterales bacterium]|nr:SDR family NAD(P)-dependent oxidoreductase [Desulfobacterales bacterium]